MATVKAINDRCLGYAGLFLVGAISWVADHLGPASRPTPVGQTRTAERPAATPGRTFRSPVSTPVVQRTSG